MIDKDTVIRTEDRLKTAHLDGEAIVLDTSSGRYFGVNELGARVLTLIENPVTMQEVCDTLAGEYAVERSRLEQDVAAFLSDLKAKNLVSLGT